MLFSRYIALAASVATTSAQYKGFNYGSTNPDGSGKVQADFQNEFTTAANLVGASGFTSARLYTTVQAGTANSPISAIPAAIATKTSLLLGLWASAGQDSFNNELAALRAAIQQYGTAFADLVVGISVGSEDLYRITPTGIANNAGVGADPATLATYVGEVRNVIAGTTLSGKPVGHVDTWTAYVNSSNNALISAVDFLGVDAYPYFETTTANSIENGYARFFDAYAQTVAAAQGKPVWVTETGWPLSGPNAGQAVASVANSKAYWDSVGCALFGKTNTWWYTLFDGTPSPSFGITGSSLSTTPVFDLTCPAAASPSTAASSTLAQSSTQQQNQATVVPAASSTLATSVGSASAAASSGATVVSSADASSAAGSSAGVTSATGTVVAATSNAAAGTTTVQGATTQRTGTAVTTGPVVMATTSAGSPSLSCPAALTGTWEYPHLIVPIDKNQPSTALGTSYSGTFNDHVSSVFNFDLPASYAGKTCSLVFLFPTKDQLQTSDFTLTGTGGLDVYELDSPVTESTTYSTVPNGFKLASVADVKPGNSYVIASHECAAGKRVSFEFEATGTLALSYFQNSGPSPIGAYITVC